MPKEAVLEYEDEEEDEEEGESPPLGPGQTGFGDPEGLGNVRLELADDWLVEDLASFLSSTRLVYATISLFLTAPDQHFLKAFFQQMALDSGIQSANAPRWKDRLLRSQPPEAKLALAWIHIASPGWAEVVGQLNPLTVAMDAVKLVRDWKTTVEKQKLDNERLRLENNKLKADVEAKRAENEAQRAKLAHAAQTADLELQARALENHKHYLENTALHLQNESKELENKAKELANQKAMFEAGKKARFEAAMMGQSLIQEQLKNLERAGVSQADRKAFVKALVLEPLEELVEFVLNGKLKGAEVPGAA